MIITLKTKLNLIKPNLNNGIKIYQLYIKKKKTVKDTL